MEDNKGHIIKDRQYYKFCLYGFLKNLRFFEPFLIIFFLQKDLSFLDIGILYAIREISINLFEIPSGIIADTFGRRLTLASTFIIYIVSFLVFFIGQGFILFAAAMVLYALGDAARSGINKAIIVSYLIKTGQSDLRLDYYGHTRSWSQVGSAVSSLAAGFLVFFNQNLNIIFLYSIIPYIVDFFNVLSYPKHLDEHRKQETSFSKRIAEIAAMFAMTIRQPYLLKALLNAAIYSGFYKSLKDFIQPFLKSSIVLIPFFSFHNEHQKLSILLGLTYFFMFLANAIASRKANKVTNLLGSRIRLLNATLITGAVLGVITGFLMSSLIYPLIIILLFIMLLLFENLRKPAAVAEITLTSQEEVHTSVLSVMSQLTSIFTAIFAIIIGYVADRYSLGLGIATVSILILFLFPFTRLVAEKGKY